MLLSSADSDMPFTQEFSHDEDDEDEAERVQESVESWSRMSRVEDSAELTDAEQTKEHAPSAGAKIAVDVCLRC